MAKLALEYSIPVIVTIDTEKRRILSVNVDDESLDTKNPIKIEYAYGDPNYSHDFKIHPHHALRLEALEVVEEEEDWPGWEFGF